MGAVLPPRWLKKPIAAPKRGPATRLHVPQARANRGFSFTEYLIVAVLALATLESISQPLFGFQLNQTILKHLPFALMVPVLLLHLIGLLLTRRAAPGADFFVLWPLLALAAFALVGSLIAKYEFQEQDTYLTFAVYLLLMPFYIMTVSSRPDVLRTWATALVSIWALAAVASTAGTVARGFDHGSLHEIEYLITTGFLALYYVTRSRWLKGLTLLLLLVAAMFNHKLTGYIVAAMALLNIAMAGGWRHLMPQWRGLYTIMAAIATVLLSVSVILIYFQFREYLPSGNTEVRLSQYDAAWRQFLDSPIWGYAYTHGSGEGYREFNKIYNIPTHSDIIDLLKHGGIIAFGLFSLGYLKVFLLLNRAVSMTHDDRILNAFFIGARFFQITTLATFAINPLLLKAPYLILITANLGVAVGMALAMKRRLALAQS